jgi:septum formation protein
MALILASVSPRRLDLLKQVGIVPSSVVPADINEIPKKLEIPRDLALRLSAEKAKAVVAEHKGTFILAADTVVGCGRRILPKAETADEVRDCLSLLSGRRHHVYGGIALVRPDGKLSTRLVDTVVQFKKFSAAEIESYIAGGEGLGKAGGYAIQGRAAAFVSFISGSYSNVVGLSLYDVSAMLSGAGFKA